MVHMNVLRPRHEEVLAPPRLSGAQIALIAGVWLAVMAAFVLMAVVS